VRIPDILAKCVAFLMYKPKDSDELAYAGTCFLAQVPLKANGRATYYLVTAWHVIAEITRRSGDGIAYIRVNRENGEITHVKGALKNWRRHPTDTLVDVAACPWQPYDIDDTADPPKTTLAPMDLIPVGTDLFANAEQFKSNRIGIGDHVICIGLFSRFVGTDKNMPIVRFGQIALMPDEPVPTKYFGNMEAFLIEVRSVGGLSGSPIFLYSTTPRFIATNDVRREGLFLLLGLVHGHWDTPEAPTSAAVPSSERLNVGIAVAIPAQKILEVLDHPDFIRMRAEIDATGKARLEGPLEESTLKKATPPIPGA
jgi:hypothetical protein